jgi:hypothetical protein
MGQTSPYSYDPILLSSSSKQHKATSLHIPWLPTRMAEYTGPTLAIIPVARLAGRAASGEPEAKEGTGFSGALEKVEGFGK